MSLVFANGLEVARLHALGFLVGFSGGKLSLEGRVGPVGLFGIGLARWKVQECTTCEAVIVGLIAKDS